MSMDVRIYREEDFESAWPLLQQVSRLYLATDVDSAEQTRSYPKDTVLSEGSGIELALAIDGQTPIGMAAFEILHPGPNATGQLYSKELFILEEDRGKGAGRAITKFLAVHALKQNCSRFDWTGETTNLDGLKLYRALGIAPAEESIYFRLSDKALEKSART